MSNVLNLKNSKTMWGIELIFSLIEAVKNMLFWVMTPKCSWSISLQDLLLLTYYGFLVLILGIHCYTVLVLQIIPSFFGLSKPDFQNPIYLLRCSTIKNNWYIFNDRNLLPLWALVFRNITGLPQIWKAWKSLKNCQILSMSW